ncbi:MAG: 30S ribosomal protein S16 [Thermoanaerobaculia bacterium]
MLKIRLRRMGSAGNPHYRVVVSDSRRAPTAAVVDEVGHYDPRAKPARVDIDAARIRAWMAKGALVTPTVKKLLRAQKAAAS